MAQQNLGSYSWVVLTVVLLFVGTFNLLMNPDLVPKVRAQSSDCSAEEYPLCPSGQVLFCCGGECMCIDEGSDTSGCCAG
jgi:hypothetical protein